MSMSKYQFYSLGYVAEDKDTNDSYVNVYPTEITPGLEGELNTINTVKTNVTDSSGNNISVNVNKSNSIRAKWKGDGTNRITPPDVCKGETVSLWNYAGTDRYYWSKEIPEPDLRKREKVVYFFSNKGNVNDPDFINKGYRFVVDTYNKFIGLFTTKNDGEATNYEVSLDTKSGILSIEDGIGNSLYLRSTKGEWVVTTNNRVRFNTKKFAVSNGSDEIVKILLDLIDANMAESHVGNLGKPTVLTGGSKSKYSAIKSRLSKFLDN